MKSARSGFTLIELLVVMVVIGISLSLIVVRFGRDEAGPLEAEAQRLALLLRHASDEAIAGGRPLAWRAAADGYAFSRKSRGGWVPVGGDSVLKPRKWPAPVTLAGMQIAGAAAVPGEALLFSAGGWNAPFELVLASGELRIGLAGDGAGTVRVARLERP